MSGVLLKGRRLLIVTEALDAFMDIVYNSRTEEEAAEKAREYWRRLHETRDIYSKVKEGE